MNLTGFIEVDVHGLRIHEALSKIDNALRKAGPSVYRIRVIHGYNGGTGIRDEIYRQMRNNRYSKVKRLEQGSNQGVTELVLRDY